MVYHMLCVLFWAGMVLDFWGKMLYIMIMKLINVPVEWNEREKVVTECLPKVLDRYNYLRFIEGIAMAYKTRHVLAELKMAWHECVKLQCVDSRLYSLYMVAKQKGEELRQLTREEEADRRAVEGVLEPQYHKGDICGYVRRYSDSLLALQLKAGNPERYQEKQQVEMKGIMLNLNVAGVEREPVKGDV